MPSSSLVGWGGRGGEGVVHFNLVSASGWTSGCTRSKLTHRLLIMSEPFLLPVNRSTFFCYFSILLADVTERPLFTDGRNDADRQRFQNNSTINQNRNGHRIGSVNGQLIDWWIQTTLQLKFRLFLFVGWFLCLFVCFFFDFIASSNSLEWIYWTWITNSNTNVSTLGERGGGLWSNPTFLLWLNIWRLPKKNGGSNMT